MATMTKKDETRLRNDFALHVSLIMRQDGVTKSKAVFLAWAEGPKSLDARLERGSAPTPAPTPAATAKA